MSVIIKTLDLPSNCDECWFSKWSNYHQTACCRLNDYEPVADDFSRDYKQKRADFCPIEPWPEHLTDDDFETIRIHLSAIKEGLFNQGRLKEAKEYDQLITRVMAFAYTKPVISLSDLFPAPRESSRETPPGCFFDKCIEEGRLLCTNCPHYRARTILGR